MKTNKKGCIFDLDGVLCDTAKYHFLAWKQLADSLNINFSIQDNELLKGVSRMDSLDILLKDKKDKYSNSEKIVMAEMKNNIYLDYIHQMNSSELNSGVVDFILLLKQHDIGISLGSVSKNAPLILDKLKITYLFDAIVDGNSVSKAKPDPEVFINAAEQLSVSPNNCLVFEDAYAGVEAAHRADMLCIGVGCKDNLPNADFIIHNFNCNNLNLLMAKLGYL